jgi:hypothetical protein
MEDFKQRQYQFIAALALSTVPQLQKKRSYIAEKNVAQNMLHDHSHCHSDVKLVSFPTEIQQENIMDSASPIDSQHFFDMFALSMVRMKILLQSS